jgi:toluene monooxygenase system protein E
MGATLRRRYAPTWEGVDELAGPKPVTPYLDQTFRLQWMDAEPYFPDQLWHRPTALSGSDWERFRDPDEYTYYKYVSERAKAAELIGHWMELGRDLQVGVGKRWRECWLEVFTPFKFVHGQLATQLSGFSSFVKSSYENFFVVFTSFDELNTLYRTVEVSRLIRVEGTPYEARPIWRDAPHFRALRDLLERTAALQDAYEMGYVLLRLVKPLILQAYFPILVHWSREEGDFLAHHVFSVLQRDWEWHLRGGEALYGARVDDDPGNAEVLGRWQAQWMEGVVDAVKPVVLHAAQLLQRKAAGEALIDEARAALSRA